jgi:hypothetical protein
MKRIRPLIGGLLACGIALAMVTSLSAQNVQPGMAKVVNIKGSARYMTGANASWQPLKSGTILKSGAIIQTAAGSYVDVVLNNAEAAGPALSAISAGAQGAGGAGAGSGVAYQPKAKQDAVRIFENTVLGIDKLTVEETGVETITQTQFDLKAGSIFGVVRKLSAGSKYEVKLPNGVAGIRGTVYYITATGIVRVLSGSVVVAFAGPDGAIRTVEVKEGFQFDIRGGPDSQPSPMSQKEMTSLREPESQLVVAREAPVITVPETISFVSPVSGKDQVQP